MDEKLLAFCERAVESWSKTTLSQKDLAEYIEKTLTHVVLLKLLAEMAERRLAAVLDEGRYVERAVQKWSVGHAEVTVPNEITRRFKMALKDLDAYALADEIVASEMAAHSMWQSGMTSDSIAERLKVSPDEVDKLLKRARARQKALRSRLAAYG